jgi:hypothetical protein
VKANLLALYWELFEKQQVYKRWWMAVAVFTVGTHVGCWFASAEVCHPASNYFIFGMADARFCRGEMALLMC